MGLSQQTVALAQKNLNAYKSSNILKVDGILGGKTQKVYQDVVRTLDLLEDEHSFKKIPGLENLGIDRWGDPLYATCVSEGVLSSYNFKGVSGLFIPKGVLIHHTAGPVGREKMPVETFEKGRPGLSGPLVQVGIERSGDILFFTNGRAHHAGIGSNAVLKNLGTPDVENTWYGVEDIYGNSYFLGIEVDHSGRDRESEPVPKVQLDAAVKVAAMWCQLWKWNEFHVIGHREWTQRKVDPIFSMEDFRHKVALQLLGRKYPSMRKDTETISDSKDSISERLSILEDKQKDLEKRVESLEKNNLPC